LLAEQDARDRALRTAARSVRRELETRLAELCKTEGSLGRAEVQAAERMLETDPATLAGAAAALRRGGYDLVLECNRVLRHVQSKSSYRGAKTSDVAVNLKLARRHSGCVIWVLFDQDTLQLGPFLWYGGAPGEPLPHLGDKVARHSKANAQGRKTERPNLRVVARRLFVSLASMEEVVTALFGPCEGSGQS
jgi:hypothetical protein